MKFLLVLVMISTAAQAWDGYDYQRGQYVEIEKGNLVRQGRDIDVYEYGLNGGYKTYEVESVRSRLRGAEIEVRDTETGELRTFDMDD